MQIEISFDDDDLPDLYDNLGANAAADEAGIDDADRADWLRVTYLEPLVDGFLLDQITGAKQNKAYDTMMIKARVDQGILASKVEEAQASRQAALKIAPAKDLPADAPVKGVSDAKN